MTDIHTHILPGIDDGAADIYDSIEMAAIARDNGTTVIVATPHCNIPDLYSNYFGKEYIDTFERTKAILKREIPEITLYAGMEVFATDHLPQLIRDGRIISLNRSRYLLMEFDFGEDPDYADDMIRIVKERKLIPLIAHAERYEFVQDNPEIVYGWKLRGCEIQVNKGSFMGRFGQQARRTAFELLNHNLITAVASDAHSPFQRTPCMADAYQYLNEEYSKEYLDVLFEQNPGKICSGLSPVRFCRVPFEDADTE